MKLRSGKRLSSELSKDSKELRSGKELSVEKSFTIPAPVKLELKKNIDTLKSLLKDDQNFLKKIVEQFSLLGTELFINDVEQLVKDKYPIPYGHDSLLLYTVSDLMALIGCRHPLIREELAKLPIRANDIRGWERVQHSLHTEIEKEITNSIFRESTIEESSVNVIGETEHLVNIDI